MAALLAAASLSAQEPPDTTARDSLPRAVLAPLTVTVTRTDAPLLEVPYGVSVVAREELRRGRATAGLDEALVTVPGILVQNRYNYALDQRVVIRGFGARSAFGVRGVTVLLDGIPQTLPDGQGQLTNVDVAEVERIEVLRGPASALYGNAAGGVVSLRSLLGGPDAVQPTGSVRVGSYGFVKAAAAGGAPMGRGALRGSAAGTTVGGFREHSQADLRHAALGLAQALDSRTRLVVHLRATDMPLAQNPGALTAGEMDTLPSQADPRNLNADARKIVSQVQAGASVRREVAGRGTLDLAGFVLRRDLENPLAFAEIGLDRWAYGLRASARLPLGAAPAAPVVTAGLDAQWQWDDRINRTPDGSTVTLDQLERVSDVGPFVQATAHPTDRITVTAGLRYDRVRFVAADRLLADGDDSGARTMAAVSGSGGVSVALADAAAPYVSVGTAFETPTTTELVNRPDGGGGLNPEIEPQQAVNVELGVRGSVAGRLRYTAAAYHVSVTGELIPFEVATQPGRQFFRNAGSSRHRGLDVSLEAEPAGGVGIVAAYTFADYRFEDYVVGADTLDGNRIPGVPRHRLHWSVRYRAAGGFWGALDHTYTAAAFADDANTARAASWWTSDVRAGWEAGLGRGRVAPFVSVLNLFGARYAGSLVVNARGGRYFEPAPGRNVVVGVELRL